MSRRTGNNYSGPRFVFARSLPPAPTEPAAGRTCEARPCELPAIGWRWFSSRRHWLPACRAHLSARGVRHAWRRYDGEVAP